MQQDFYQFDEEYRNEISTVDASGNRIWVYPKKPKGRYTTYRTIVAVILIGALLLGPFLKINGHPLLLLNVFERRFIIFGTPFWPQDMYLFAIATIALFVFIILFTSSFGRIWCGWTCPQTLFMEMVFRKIEYLIEGDANKQRKLNAAPWTSDKILKKGSKFFIFLLVSLIISHTLMAYLIGADQMLAIISQPPAENMSGFMGLIFFTGLFFWVFAYFREQACTVVCPYGRLQGVLLGKDSIVVIYDWLRGEPRGRLKKGEVQQDKGDCIDCKLCVHACPTGIDIRNGTQLECVNCTTCIDACDEVMTKIDKPKGLIRFSSFNGIKEGKLKIFTTRIIAYSVVSVILVFLLGFLLVTRTEVEATVLRVPGQLYQRTEDGGIANLYTIQFINKTFDPIELNVDIKDEKGSIKRVGGINTILVPVNQTVDGVFFVNLDEDDLDGYKTQIIFRILRDGEVIDEIKTNFLGPATKSK